MSLSEGISRMLLEGLKSVLKVLEANKIQYAVMGGIALQAWSRPRSTRDLDISIYLDNLAEDQFIKVMRQSGFRFANSSTLGNTKLLRFSKECGPAGFDIEVDLFQSTTDYHKEALKRSVTLELSDFSMRVFSPEDLLLQKLAAGRALDLYDAEELIKNQRRHLDWSYLRHWALQLGLQELLLKVSSQTSDTA